MKTTRVPDLEVKHLKDIPGYKAILKAVLRSQIQVLVDQLADNTGEESVILTASVTDGTLCHLGSGDGLDFLDGRDEIKSQFLRHCMKKQQRRQDSDDGSGLEGSALHASAMGTYQQHQSPHHSITETRVHPVALRKAGRHKPESPISYHDEGDMQPRKAMRLDHHSSTPRNRRTVMSSTSSSPAATSFVTTPNTHSSPYPSLSESNRKQLVPSATHGYQSGDGVGVLKVDLSEVDAGYGESEQTAVSRNQSQDNNRPAADSSETPRVPSKDSVPETRVPSKGLSQSDSSENVVDQSLVKVEPISESEMELEITGVTLAEHSQADSQSRYPSDVDWSAVTDGLGYGPSTSAEGQNLGDNPEDQSGMAYSMPKTKKHIEKSTLAESDTSSVPSNDELDLVYIGSTSSKKRKRGHYNNYDDETRARMAKHALCYGISKTARKFSEELGCQVNESTVRNMKVQFVKRQSMQGGTLSEANTLPKFQRGRPVSLGELDKTVQNWIRKNNTGNVINARIVMAVGEAIVSKYAKHSLQEHGGHIRITKTWAVSVLRRMNFKKTSGIKTEKEMLCNFLDIKNTFSSKVCNVIEENAVPDQLVISWDEMQLPLVPGGDWTPASEEARRQSVQGSESKCQMTVFLAVAMDGTLLPPQLVYTGKTSRSLPKVNFPADWNVTLSDSNLISEDTVLEYAEKILVPYVDRQREQLPANQKEQKAVILFDFQKSNRNEVLLSRLKDSNVVPVSVPSACRDKLQPVSWSVMPSFKESVKSLFSQWYTEQIMQMGEILDLDRGTVGGDVELTTARVDLGAANMKPLHARWLISAYERLCLVPEKLKEGFVQAGLKEES